MVTAEHRISERDGKKGERIVSIERPNGASQTVDLSAWGEQVKRRELRIGIIGLEAISVCRLYCSSMT